MPAGRYVVAAEGVVHRWLVSHSIAILRVSLGLVFMAFGALKYVPGASPAADLAVDTTRILTFGAVPDALALVLVATVECGIGLSLILGRGLRVTMYLLVLELLGILSPLVLLPERLFPAPWHTPTLEGQYVLKDIVLVGAVMVVVATAFRGARITVPHTGGPATGRPGGPTTYRTPYISLASHTNDTAIAAPEAPDAHARSRRPTAPWSPGPASDSSRAPGDDVRRGQDVAVIWPARRGTIIEGGGAARRGGFEDRACRGRRAEPGAGDRVRER